MKHHHAFKAGSFEKSVSGVNEKSGAEVDVDTQDEEEAISYEDHGEIEDPWEISDQ